MRYYMIAIGGTGAKCVESFVHLAAAGLMPAESAVRTLFVDPDDHNGTLGRALQALHAYQACKKLQTGDAPIFTADLLTTSPEVWSPLPDPSTRTLERFYAYDKSKNQDSSYLMDALFTKQQREAELDLGFLGNPSIGAAVLGGTVSLRNKEPWKTLFDNIAEDSANKGGARVFLAGSLFGGTGASGLPTIAKLIASELKDSKIENVKLGAVMMLPYFSFDKARDGRLRADSVDFLPATQAALRYYFEQEYLKVFHSIYLLGDEQPAQMSWPSKGGKDQNNEPHYLELYAGLAALDFFQKAGPNGCRLIARRPTANLDWDDLPPYRVTLPNGKGTQDRLVRQSLGQMLRFAVAYRYNYYPVAKNIVGRGGEHNAPWYRPFFNTQQVQNQDTLENELNHLWDYCNRFLLWFAGIHFSGAAAGVRLANYQSFAGIVENDNVKDVRLLSRMRDDDFSQLLLPVRKQENLTLKYLWSKMSDASRADQRSSGTGAFVNVLYKECGRGLL